MVEIKEMMIKSYSVNIQTLISCVVKIFHKAIVPLFTCVRSIVVPLFLSLLLSSCSRDRCIDADDFGFNKFTISSRYNSDVITSLNSENQVAPWIDSHFRVNGRPLTIVVKTWEKMDGDWNSSQELSAWCPWYGTGSNFRKLSTFSERFNECEFLNNDMSAGTKDAQIMNAPCLLKNGVGLYALIAPWGDVGPNSSYLQEQNPTGITMHLGEKPVGYNLYDISKKGIPRDARGVVYSYNDEDKKKYAAGALYFKILDKYYDDNAGQYKIVIKSGVSESRPDPIEFVTKLVKDNLFGNSDKPGLIQQTYLNIISNQGYRSAVMGMLSLYIIFSALSYLTGNINITNTELIVRVVKIAIVSALLNSTYAWSFFNDYLFVYFVGGVEQMLSMIKEAGATGPGSSSILGLMIAPQTISKAMALLFMDWRGFIYIILYLVALYFIIMIMFEAAVLYLTSLISIGMIIIMGPIFICFLLFDITRSLFENWLKQLIGYALQPIILFTGIAFISMIIRTELYSTLGFRVCNMDFPNLGGISDILGSVSDELDIGIDLTQSIFYWGFPNPMDGFSRLKKPIPIPMDFYKDDGTFCEAYGCIGERYVELPFLDPDKDAQKIENFFNGNFLQFDGLLLIFISLYLLQKFNSVSVSMSQFISSTSGNLTKTQSIAGDATKPIQDQIDKGLMAPLKYADEKLGLGIRSKIEGVKAFAHGNYKEWSNQRLGNQALTSPDAKILAEIKKSTGVDYTPLPLSASSAARGEEQSPVGGINVKAISKYESALANKLQKEFGIKDYKGAAGLFQKALSLDDNENSSAVAKELSSKKLPELKDKLALLLNRDRKNDDRIKLSGVLRQGPKYSDLTKADQEKIDRVVDDKDFQSLYKDAMETQKYQDIYNKTAKSMGIFGGKPEINSLKEIERKKQLKEADRGKVGDSAMKQEEERRKKALEEEEEARKLRDGR